MRNNIAKAYYVDIRLMAVQSYVFVESADHLLLTPSWATELFFFFFLAIVFVTMFLLLSCLLQLPRILQAEAQTCVLSHSINPANQSHTASSID